jgi:hypothetical protein
MFHNHSRNVSTVSNVSNENSDTKLVANISNENNVSSVSDTLGLTDKQKYICQYCEKSFSTNSNLLAHLRNTKKCIYRRKNNSSNNTALDISSNKDIKPREQMFLDMFLQLMVKQQELMQLLYTHILFATPQQQFSDNVFQKEKHNIELQLSLLLHTETTLVWANIIKQDANIVILNKEDDPILHMSSIFVHLKILLYDPTNKDDIYMLFVVPTENTHNNILHSKPLGQCISNDRILAVKRT